jgi:hypothetical protein
VTAATARTRRWRAHLSRGHVVVLLAGLTGTLLTLVALRSAAATVPVLVAARDLAPGVVVDARSVATTRIHADASVLARFVDAGSTRETVGLVVTRRVEAGTLLERDALAAPTGREVPRSISFPLPRARAVAGAIAAGDRVDAVAVDPRTGRARFVLVDTEVLDVDDGASGPLAATDDVVVTVAIDGPRALRLASALETDTLTLLRATGAPELEATVLAPRSTNSRASDDG